MIETLGEFEAALRRRPEEIIEARQNGTKVIGYFCCNTPVEIIHSLGLIPIRLGWGGDDALADDGIPYITAIQCPYVRQTIGVFKENKNPYAVNSDIIAISAVCLQEYRMAEILRYYFGKTTLTLSIPKNFYLPEGREYFIKEINWFAGELEKIAGTKLDDEKLRKSIDLYGEIRKNISEIYNLLALDNSPITWSQILKVIQTGFYLYPEKYLTLLQKLNNELKTKPDSDRVKPKKEVRVLLSGSIIAPGNTKIIEVLEGLGIKIVADDICTGQRTFAGLKINEPTLAGISNAYLDKIPCAAQLYPFRETDKRLENIFHLIDAHRADGVIYHTIRFCDPMTFRVEENKNLLSEKGIPFLQLHTDYGVSDIGQLQTRAGALLEMIKRQKKEVLYATTCARV